MSSTRTKREGGTKGLGRRAKRQRDGLEIPSESQISLKRSGQVYVATTTHHCPQIEAIFLPSVLESGTSTKGYPNKPSTLSWISSSRMVQSKQSHKWSNSKYLITNHKIPMFPPPVKYNQGSEASCLTWSSRILGHLIGLLPGLFLDVGPLSALLPLPQLLHLWENFRVIV